METESNMKFIEIMWQCVLCNKCRPKGFPSQWQPSTH